MPQLLVPPAANRWINQPGAAAQLATLKIPPNAAQGMTPELQGRILLYINQNYAWPQIQERVPFEGMWDACWNMYRIQLPKSDTNVQEDTRAGRSQTQDKRSPNVKLADSVVHDAVERLTDITSFVSFKESLPVQFNVPPFFNNAKADQFYDPVGRIVQGANALLSWNFNNENMFRKYITAARHFYLYGIAFAVSDWLMEAEISQKMTMAGPVPTVQWTRLGTSFDPLSLRKVWLNWRLSAYEMDYQPCPFYFQDAPFFSIRQRAYDPTTNPFGFANLDRLGDGKQTNWVFTDQAMKSMRTAIEALVRDNVGTAGGGAGGNSLAQLLKEEHGVTGLWNFFPMLPFDPQTGEFETRPDGTPIPFRRFIVNIYGQNFSGRQVLLRLQPNYYPGNSVPIYGSSHMPDLDSGAYTPSLGQLLWNHYRELVTCMEQYVTNKDLINDPPAWVQTSSPAQNQDINRPGEKIKVNGPNDFGWRQVPDGTGSTAAVAQMIRTGAQTTSKSTDAILGKAMGSRTSATEANNAFQASMSAVTTPINLFNHDMMGGYADRLWDYTGTWMPAEILQAITGSKDMEGLKPEDLHLRIGRKTDWGSSFVESVVRQQNIRYVLESSAGDPVVNRAPLWKMLFQEFKFPRWEELVEDGGMEREIEIATEQAIDAFQGRQAMVNPDQNHTVAIRVKTRFLEDPTSRWMTEFKQNAMAVVMQIQIHQQFLMLQLQEQLAHAALGQTGLPSGMGGGLPPGLLEAAGGGGGAPPLMGGPPQGGAGPAAAGQQSQQGGGQL